MRQAQTTTPKIRKRILCSQRKKHERKEKTPIRSKPSITRSIADAVILKSKNVFFLVRPDGDVPLEINHGFGLYYHDCRYLNGYQLKLAGVSLKIRATTMLSGSSAIIRLSNPELRLPEGKHLNADEIGLTWERHLDGDKNKLNDKIRVKNYSDKTVNFPLSLALQAEFEDIFIIRGLLSEQPGNLCLRKCNERELIFIYQGADQIYRGLSIHFSIPSSRCDETGVQIDFALEPAESQEFSISLTISEASERQKLQLENTTQIELSKTCTPTAGKLIRQLADQTLFQSDSLLLNGVLENSLNDLRTLVTSINGHEFFAAGVPWFATLFGRDSLITALQTLSIQPNIAAETLRLLAEFQAEKTDDWTDAQPGKILHELRIGELARLGHVPHTPYFGTIDATPLFLILLVQYTQWTGDLTLFRELKNSVLRALEWIDQDGDANGDGYVEYVSTSPKGLVNQGWKDSGNAIVDAEGNPAQLPISLVEVQGYVYQAKTGLAELFERAGEPERALQLRQQAKTLRSKFNCDFWMEDQGTYALALDGSSKPLRVVSSNAGYTLWTGIADLDKARQTAERLMANDMFSGWGIRTLSSKENSYNPTGYHLGTVWPHDNALIAAGFRRYGLDEFAQRILTGILEAAMTFDGYRLPELFAGYSRDEHTVPVRYPVSCHPQAWAAGSIPYLISSFLGLDPAAFEGELRIRRPILPDCVNSIRVRKLRVGYAKVDLYYERESNGKVKVDVENIEGKLLVINS